MKEQEKNNLNEIKAAIQAFGDKDPEDLLNSIIEGKKLSNEDIHDLFYEILPWMSMSLLNRRFRRIKKETDTQWEELQKISLDIESLGVIENLEILPLIDRKTENSDLITEHGVSYLIKTGDTTILFDTGLNKDRKHPSPLMHNMKVLGIDTKVINKVFISHPHGDHCGGIIWVRDGSFGLSAEQQDLTEVTAFTPTAMSHPTAKTIQVDKPQIIGKGIASTGPITQPMFFSGYTIEQSLVINVKEKGLVIIVGCGHQSVKSILERVDAMFENKIPIYALIGGVHLPIPKFPDRQDWMGIPWYKFTGTRRPIWEPWSEKDLKEAIDSLKSRNVKVVSISSHDSSDESIEAFRSEFENYLDLRVGKPIIF